MLTITVISLLISIIKFLFPSLIVINVVGEKNLWPSAQNKGGFASKVLPKNGYLLLLFTDRQYRIK